VSGDGAGASSRRAWRGATRRTGGVAVEVVNLRGPAELRKRTDLATYAVFAGAAL
jgi:hypothetical protein